LGGQAFRNHVGAVHAKRVFKSLGPLKGFIREERKESSFHSISSSSIYAQPTFEPVDAIAARVISPAPSLRVEDLFPLSDLGVVVEEPSVPSSEQSLQDLYCAIRKIPKKKQAQRGIDYHDPIVGYIEFTRNGEVDSKDISTYRTQAENEPYKVVFVDGVPPSIELAEALTQLRVDWEVFNPAVQQAVAA